MNLINARARFPAMPARTMTSILYALNISTLATWLAVAGASTVACVVKVDGRLPERVEESAERTELFITSQEMGSAPAGPVAETANEELVAEPPLADAPLEPIPEVAEVPELAEIEPLPEVPQLPDALPAPVQREREAKPTGSPAPEMPREKTRPARPAKPAGAVAGGGSGSGQGNAAVGGAGASAAGSDRWQGLRKSSPNYPPAARRAGQEGKVVVQFTVDDRGYVVAATVVSPSPYPALNEEALRTVRRFRATPGVRATTSQPIIFRLN